MAQLPYNPQGPARQYLALSVNNPPFYPNNIQCSAAVKAVINQLCACTAIEIQTQSGGNPIRMTVYNLLSENNYSNSNFVQLLQIIAMRIDAELIANPNTIPAVLADNVIPRAVSYYTGFIASQYPDLAQYVNRQVYDAALHAGQQLAGYCQEAEQIIKNFMNRNTSFQQPMVGAAPQPINYGGMGGGYTNNYGRRSGDMQATDRFFSGGDSEPKTVTNNLFGGLKIQPASNQEVADNGFSVKWNAAPQNNEPPVANKPVPPKEPSISDFFATEEQPYILGYSPRTHYQELEYTSNGAVKQYVEERQVPMDYDKHGAPYPSFMAKAPWKENFQAVAEATEKLMTAINDDIRDSIMDDDVSLFSKGNVLASKTMIADTGLQAAIAAARFYRSETKMENPDLMAFSMTANLKTYLHEVDLSDEVIAEANSILDNLPFHSSFVEVRDSINKLPDDFKRLHLRKLNSILTKEINCIFRHNLNIGLKINDFMDAIGEIDEIIAGDYGRLMLASWLKHQGSHIGKMFSVELDGNSVELFDRGETIKKKCLDRYVTITHLSMPAVALDIEIPENRSVLIEKELNPVLHELVSVYLPQVENYNEAHRNYIVTLDGLIFEVLPGWLVDGSLLIRFIGEEI